MKKRNKLGVIVPYRGRYDHLIQFKNHIQKYLKFKKIDSELIVIEQDGEKTFNRGKLLNIGFKYAQVLECDYVVFHDVDMLPIDADYSYSDIPLHLATNFTTKRIVFDDYFGGVTIFPTEIFEQINGYSNEYWGWGYEDNDLLYRCKINGIPLDIKEIKMMGGNTAALKFNGKDAYVKIKNIVDTSEPITFFVNFYPDDIYCDHTHYDDTYSIFTIPGLDLTISYNSYMKYNFELYDSNENIIYINSEIKTNYKTAICITIDPKEKIIKMYQDGIIIGTKKYTNELYNYSQERYMYLGVGNPKNNQFPKYFYGLISSFGVFSKVLDEKEIKEISNNQFFGLTQDFGEYKSAEYLKLYYDAKFIKGYKLIDLSGNDNNGNIVRCEIVGYSFESSKAIEIPYRRKSLFDLLPHEENGYVGNAWKDITTRYNQLRYYNEVARGFRNPKEDGLTSCLFKERSNGEIGNEHHIVVAI